jgi:hypothetical protein
MITSSMRFVKTDDSYFTCYCWYFSLSYHCRVLLWAAWTLSVSSAHILYQFSIFSTAGCAVRVFTTMQLTKDPIGTFKSQPIQLLINSSHNLTLPSIANFNSSFILFVFLTSKKWLFQVKLYLNCFQWLWGICFDHWEEFIHDVDNFTHHFETCFINVNLVLGGYLLGLITNGILLIQGIVYGAEGPKKA